MKNGTYRYAVRSLDPIKFIPVFSARTMPVTILEETDTQYKIEFGRNHADGRKVGTVTRVAKKNVTIKPAPPEDVRQPYKD